MTNKFMRTIKINQKKKHESFWLNSCDKIKLFNDFKWSQ